MPEKPLTVATYAAGASLAAITLIYVFAPTFFIDGDGNAARKKGVVGLSNPANDCFINSVLQSLAGLGDLRLYLIRETHRRSLDDPDVYAVHSAELTAAERKVDPIMLDGLRRGIVTQALKNVLDSLNERPIYRKTVSANPFLRILEHGFRQKISRQQQDAQEFLQVLAERLNDEYYAGRKARARAELKSVDGIHKTTSITDQSPSPRGSGDISNPLEKAQAPITAPQSGSDGQEANIEEEGFPLEGRLESQIECQHCRFQPKPSKSTFVTLTLNVPQQNSTTLNECFDGLFKKEYIEDFRCEYCRLRHAIEVKQVELRKANSDSTRTSLKDEISRLDEAVTDDPESPPKDISLPDIKTAPLRRISRHLKITAFPKIVAIHLSRSIFDPRTASIKNYAKVAFPEQLSLGGILDRRKYKLLGLVTHRGSHHSGHYESFRRQNLYAPFSTPNKIQPVSNRTALAVPTPNGSGTPAKGRSSSTTSSSLAATTLGSPSDTSSLSPSPSQSSTFSHPASERDSSDSADTSNIPRIQAPTSNPQETIPLPHITRPQSPEEQPSLAPPQNLASRTKSRPSSLAPSDHQPPVSRSVSLTDLARFKRSSGRHHHGGGGGKGGDRWWRISDEKIKESKTSEVLAMQREVYLLFYELDEPKGEM